MNYSNKWDPGTVSVDIIKMKGTLTLIMWILYLERHALYWNLVLDIVYLLPICINYDRHSEKTKLSRIMTYQNEIPENDFFWYLYFRQRSDSELRSNEITLERTNFI